MSRSNRAIWQAYADTGALDTDCPNCAAPRNQWCTKADGRVRRVPCVDRTVASVAVTTAGTPRDFSEPIHETEPTS